MECSCGKELNMIRILTDDETQDLNYIDQRKSAAVEMMNSTRDKTDEMTDEQLMEYYSALHTFIAETDFLEHKFNRDLKKSLGMKHLIVNDYVIYAHD